MADFVYTTVPGKIKPLLHKIKEVGVPQKATLLLLLSALLQFRTIRIFQIRAI